MPVQFNTENRKKAYGAKLKDTMRLRSEMRCGHAPFFRTFGEIQCITLPHYYHTISPDTEHRKDQDKMIRVKTENAMQDKMSRRQKCEIR